MITSPRLDALDFISETAFSLASLNFYTSNLFIFYSFVLVQIFPLEFPLARIELFVHLACSSLWHSEE